MLKVFAIIFVAVFSQNAYAGSLEMKTGNDFLRSCKYINEGNYEKTREEVEMSGFCLGYMEGIRNMGRESYHFCIPDGTENVQLVKLVYRFMQNHPEIVERHPYVSVAHSFAGAFPCKKNK